MKYLNKFNIISESEVYNGNFIVSKTQIINGKFKENIIPEIVKGYFSCYKNNLTSLENGPKEVGNNFDCSYNYLDTLENCPEIVTGGFYCDNNKLTSLVGGPKEVKGGFYCYNNNLTSLYGISKNVREIICDDNLRIEREFINSGSYKNDYWSDLLNYCIENKENLDEINWPENFLNDNLKKSVKGINKFNI